MSDWQSVGGATAPRAGMYIVVERDGALYAGVLDDSANYLCGKGLREGHLGLLPGDRWIQIPEPK